MVHLSNVCNVDCSLRALLLDGTDQPVHCVHNVMVIIPAGVGIYIALPKIAPQETQMRDATLASRRSLGRKGGRRGYANQVPNGTA